MTSTVADIDSEQSQNTNDANDDVDETPEFFPNETTDGYYLFGDPKAYDAAVLDVCGLDKPDVNPYHLSREDIPELVERAKAEGWAPMQAKWAIDAAMKSWLGDRQRELNEGFGVGLVTNDDGVVTGFQKNQYAYFFGNTLPTLEWEEGGNDELQALRDEGYDVDTLGFRPDGKPVFPVFTEGRYPGVVTSFEELGAAVDMLAEFPDEPSLGNSAPEDDDEEVGDLLEELDYDPSEFEGGIEVADGMPNPAGFTVENLRSYIGFIESPESLRVMMESERNGKERSTALSAFESRIEAAEEALEQMEESQSRYAQAEAEQEAGVDVDDDASVTERVQAFNALTEAGVEPNEAASRVGL